MKSKIIDYVFAGLAVLGFFIIFGAIGTVDYYAEVGQYYPIGHMLKYSLLGLSLIIPAVIRWRI